jgi:tetratricopeptide (TPR) repeat protein
MNAEVAPPAETPDLLIRVREASPAKLRRRLAGDLDTIVLRAMHKEPQRRYVSVEQFSEDIRRHLNGLPVIARRDSWRYRAGKFAIRHKVGVAATALVLLAVAIGVAATIRESRIAAANERRAEERFNDVRKLANSLMFEIHDAIRDLPGSTAARRLIATRALEYLDNLSTQSKGDASLQKELAAAYERVGDVLGYPYAANLGDADGALQSYRKALAIREALASSSPDAASLRDLVAIYQRVSQVQESRGNFKEAINALVKAQPIAKSLATGSNDPVLADYYAGTYYFMAVVQVQTGDVAAALENYRRASVIRNAALQSHPNSLSLRTHLAADYSGIAHGLAEQHDLARAVEIQAQSVAILDQGSKANPGNAGLSEFLGEATNSLADYRQERGETVAALETFRQSHKIFGDLLQADPKNILAKTNFGFSNIGIAQCQLTLGKPYTAIKVFRESIATLEESPSGSNRYPRSGLASAYAGLGDAFSALALKRDLPQDQALAYWQEAHSACQKSLTVWKDKEKRGELQSSEHDDLKQAAQCVTNTEAKLHNSKSAQASLH